MHLYPEKHGKNVLRILLPLLLAIVLAALFLYGFNSVSRSTEEEQVVMTERAIRKALVNCYAVEGVYPEELSYLEEHYGLIIDHDAFVIDYQTIGSNIRPAVLVVRRGSGEHGAS